MGSVGQMKATKALVVENDSTDGLGRLGVWLAEAGLEFDVRRPYAGEELPETLDHFAAAVVLGGPQNAYDAADGTPGAPWFPRLESLLRKAVRGRVPTLGVCLGGQLLAQALGGRVERSPSGPEVGAKLVAKRDIAAADPLFGPVPFAPDVVQKHQDEIIELPAGAVLLAASTRYPHQAFRIGDRAWGLQFHIETDTEMFAIWVRDRDDGEELTAGVEAVQEDMREVWQPFAHRFADVALGRVEPGETKRGLPMLR